MFQQPRGQLIFQEKYSTHSAQRHQICGRFFIYKMLYLRSFQTFPSASQRVHCRQTCDYSSSRGDTYRPHLTAAQALINHSGNPMTAIRHQGTLATQHGVKSNGIALLTSDVSSPCGPVFRQPADNRFSDYGACTGRPKRVYFLLETESMNIWSAV
jgi:hypothetical protein